MQFDASIILLLLKGLLRSTRCNARHSWYNLEQKQRRKSCTILEAVVQNTAMQNRFSFDLFLRRHYLRNMLKHCLDGLLLLQCLKDWVAGAFFETCFILLSNLSIWVQFQLLPLQCHLWSCRKSRRQQCWSWCLSSTGQNTAWFLLSLTWK